MQLSEKETIPLAKVLADRHAYDGQYVRVSGRVRNVCQKKGCWMTMTDGSKADAVFVKFDCPIEDRLIPMNAVGKQAVVEGRVEVREITEELARHYAEDAGASPEQVSQLRGPQEQVRLSSPAARVTGI